jgi:hypothetical protein
MYQVTFIDGTEFAGGEPDQSMWDMLPDKPIQALTYWIKDSDKYHFTDFEEYNHCVERVQGVNGGFQSISKVIVMGRVGKRVYEVLFDLTQGRVYQFVAPYGEEYGSKAITNKEGYITGWEAGRPLTGWRFGILPSPENYPGPKLKRIK